MRIITVAKPPQEWNQDMAKDLGTAPHTYQDMLAVNVNKKQEFDGPYLSGSEGVYTC